MNFFTYVFVCVLFVASPQAFGQSSDVLTPEIVCEEPVFDFGEKDNTEVVEHDFVIRNDGQLSLEIRKVHAACGCTVAKPDDDVVPPGGSTRLHARLDLRGRRGKQYKTITVMSNDPKTPNLNLQMVGTALEGLRAQPGALFFGRLGPGAPRSRAFEVLSGKGPFQITSLVVGHDGILVNPIEDEPTPKGDRYRFELTLADTLPAGTLNSTIRIQTDIPGQPEIVIPVAAYLIVPPSP